MGLVNWFKANTVDSLNELQKIRLNITGIKNDISEMDKRLNGVTNKVRLRANIITAEEATAQMEEEVVAPDNKAKNEILTADEAFKNSLRAEDKHNKKLLSYAFKKINEKVEDGERACVLWSDFLWGDQVSYLDLVVLEELLPKYGYKVRLEKDGEDDRGRLYISWDKENKLELISIDPDKKYILPMERTTTSDYMRNYAYYNTGHWLVSGGALDADWAERSGYTVYGKDILSAPDWVKAIKPIEVEK